MKSKIGLVVDEGADLPEELIRKYQITVVPFSINWPDGESLPGSNIFQQMREAEKQGIKSLIDTSQPSPKQFIDVFRNKFPDFEKILCLVISSKLSGTFNSAIQAKDFLSPAEKERVFILDSLNGSAGEGLLAITAAELIERGEGMGEILRKLEELREKGIHLFGLLEDPRWLEYSGRISPTLAHWVRKMAKIGLKPLIGVKKGEVKAVGIKTGVQDLPTALFKELENQTEKPKKEGKKIRVVIAHGDYLEGAERLRELIEENLKGADVAFVNLIDRVLGARVGPGVLVLAWSEVEKDSL